MVGWLNIWVSGRIEAFGDAFYLVSRRVPYQVVDQLSDCLIKDMAKWLCRDMHRAFYQAPQQITHQYLTRRLI